MIKVSVIIPVFNGEISLRTCLSSLKKIVNSEIQIVVIDDGSSDQSSSIASEFSKEFENFTLERLSENKGVGNARNIGLKLSLGLYVYFLDCDDTVAGNFSEFLMDEFRNESDLIFSPIIKMPSGSSNELHLSLLSQGHMNSREHLLSFLESLESWPLECWGYFIRREFLSKNRIEFRNIRISEDIVFMTEILCKLETYSMLDSPTYVHNRIAGSLGKSFSNHEVASWFMAFLGMVGIAHQFSSESKEGQLILNRTATVLTYFLLDFRAVNEYSRKDFFARFKESEFHQPLRVLASTRVDQLGDFKKICMEILRNCSSNIQNLCSPLGKGKTYLYCYDRLSLGVFQIMKEQNFEVAGIIDDNIEFLIPSNRIDFQPLSSSSLDGKIPQDSTFVVCHDKREVYLQKRKQFKDFEKDGLHIIQFTTKDLVSGLNFDGLFKQSF